MTIIQCIYMTKNGKLLLLNLAHFSGRRACFMRWRCALGRFTAIWEIKLKKEVALPSRECIKRREKHVVRHMGIHTHGKSGLNCV